MEGKSKVFFPRIYLIFRNVNLEVVASSFGNSLIQSFMVSLYIALVCLRSLIWCGWWYFVGHQTVA